MMIRKTYFFAAVAVFSLVTMYLVDANVVVQPRPKLAVWDSANRKVGDIISFAVAEGGNVLIPLFALDIDRNLLVLGAWQHRFLGTSVGMGVSFESEDCSGTPFFTQSELEDQQGRAAVPLSIVAGNRIYAVDPNVASPTSAFLRSIISTSDIVFALEDHDACSPYGPFEVAGLVQAKVLLDLNTHFAPPVSVR